MEQLHLGWFMEGKVFAHSPLSPNYSPVLSENVTQPLSGHTEINPQAQDGVLHPYQIVGADWYRHGANQKNKRGI